MESKNPQIVPAKPDFSLSVPMAFDIHSGPITMHVLSEEKIEMLSSSGNPWPLAMFTLTCSNAVGILLAIYSNSVTENALPKFWAVFWAMAVLTIFFAVTAIREERRVRILKRAIREASQKVVEPAFVHSQAPREPTPPLS